MVNVSTLIGQLAPTLNAQNTANLVWWTEADLLQYADECVQKLTRENRLIAAFQSAIAMPALQADYSLPPQHVATLQIACGTLVLIEKTVAEMEALDPAWMERVATNPMEWVGDGAGMSTITLSPTPDTAGVYSIAYLAHANEVTTIAPQVDIPSVLAEYVFLSMAGRALRKETRGSKPEAAAAIDQMLAPMAEIIGGIWGHPH